MSKTEESEIEIDIEVELWNVCQSCRRVFDGKAELIRHNAVYHSEISHSPLGEKSNEDTDIIFGMVKKGKYEPICKDTDTQRTPYECNTCSKTFTRNSSLRRHSDLHTSGKLLVCQFCSRQFRKKTCLLIHMKLHENENIDVRSSPE